MTIRDSTIAKLQQLPEPLLQEVSDFIDFITQKHLGKTAESQTEEKLVEVKEETQPKLKRGNLSRLRGIAKISAATDDPDSKDDYVSYLTEKYK
ncbi:DUF2281 domain-containing protein [Phormidium sp. LEGE 05292]|uniref:DUF2281 domain-containing protein n=1 Tax=[Phormidium] sp. LEGE 05292 TaxID=767427 RepID=UPI00187E9BC4|nr:DUF2281 domain-containing protein [Phormidium sp. LEGE 05292]MBE9226135.1 DUF2281 domain-containing protein [Phormidium sp. LEGE 05292]